ncbi:V-type proton ATPase subunit C [Cloeon dipterum]|uniref:V-type proton ATPase subunit C n=1 Tax=Cloeon dipterum TaxID=197152 RepID=UPI00321FFEAA
MSEYWLISAPGDKTCQQTWETLNNVTSKQNNLSVNYKFHIPDLKVGTLDQLVGLSDDLGKLDSFVDSVTKKVASYLGEVLEDQRDKLNENLLANNSDLAGYITRFQWDLAKYPIKQSLRNIADIISKQVGQIDADLKSKSTAYNNLKGSLQNLEKKQTGSLLTRNLADLVKKDDFILDSEYLTTVLVVVPRAGYNDWNANYEKLTDMIVPRSSRKITEDAEFGLFNVTLFKKVAEEFKIHARERKFVVREFVYNEEILAAGKNEMTKLVTDKKKQFGPLVRWLKVNFSECFCAWIHVKALRVFVESVLRYGLPVNFQAMLLHPHKKSTKRLRDVLNQLYGHLDSSALQGSGKVHDTVDIPGLGFGQSEYFPYVYYKINIDMVDQKPI